jgi:hypothetical protein
VSRSAPSWCQASGHVPRSSRPVVRRALSGGLAAQPRPAPNPEAFLHGPLVATVSDRGPDEHRADDERQAPRRSRRRGRGGALRTPCSVYTRVDTTDRAAGRHGRDRRRARDGGRPAADACGNCLEAERDREPGDLMGGEFGAVPSIVRSRANALSSATSTAFVCISRTSKSGSTMRENGVPQTIAEGGR